MMSSVIVKIRSRVLTLLKSKVDKDRCRRQHVTHLSTFLNLQPRQIFNITNPKPQQTIHHNHGVPPPLSPRAAHNTKRARDGDTRIFHDPLPAGMAKHGGRDTEEQCGGEPRGATDEGDEGWECCEEEV